MLGLKLIHISKGIPWEWAVFCEKDFLSDLFDAELHGSDRIQCHQSNMQCSGKHCLYDDLIHWGRDKMAAISQTMFSNAFCWMIMYEFHLKFHWSLFLRFQLTIFQHWFRYWLGDVQATSHYLKQWWLVYWRIFTLLGLNELISSYGVMKNCNNL